MLAIAVASFRSYGSIPGTFMLPIIILLTVFVYAWLLRPLSNGRLLHIPGPWLSKISNIPLSFYDLTCCRNDQILNWHRQYGPVIRIAPNEVSVATLEGTREMYGTTYRWAKSNYFDHFKGFNMRSVFATKSYEEHREKRKAVSGFYQASTIYRLPDIEEHVKERSLAVLNQIVFGQETDVYSLTDWYALDIITFLALGPDNCTHSIERVCPERGLLMELKRQQFVGPFRVRYPKLYMCISQLLGRLNSRFSYLLADDRFATWCQERFYAALEDPCVFQSHSLIRHLLEAHKGRRGGGSVDSSYMAAEVLDNINAAEATVAVTATYFIWRLTETPRWQQKIRKELSMIPAQDDGSLSFANIDSRVPSLEACLREVYRLHPASSGRAERIVPSGGHTLSGIYLPEDTIVTTSVTALHQDESVYPDPGCFAPERWLEKDEHVLKIRDSQLIPFGYGGRICLGKALATLELKLLITRLYLKHESVRTASTDASSMKQCSTHDAVPNALKCVVRFQSIES